MPQTVNYILGIGLRRHLAFISVFRIKPGALAVPQEIYRAITASGPEPLVTFDLADAVFEAPPTQTMEPLASIADLRSGVVKLLASFLPEDANSIADQLEIAVTDQLLKIAEWESQGVEL